MNRRERAERRIERRREWAEARDRRAAAAQATNDRLMNRDPVTGRADWALVTQPGHIPQRAQANRAQERAWSEASAADAHRAKANAAERALEGVIFSDDHDAAEKLAERLAKQEARRDRMKAVNAAHRAFLKNPAALEGPKFAHLTEAERVMVRTYKPEYSWEPHPFPPCRLTNLGAEIRRTKKRMAEVDTLAKRAKATAEAGGVLIEGTGEYVRVTFEEKPEREILAALRAAGFRWGGGSWTGRCDDLPEAVRVMVHS